MKKTIDAQLGDVRVGGKNTILKSNAIGSCIAVAACDPTTGIGAMAHIMLPGAAPEDKKAEEKTKYAANAIDTMLTKLERLGSKNDNIEIALVGGGNVLNRDDDTICNDNIESVLELLCRKNLKIKAQALGGTHRRSVTLDIERASIFYSEGNGGETLLWKAG
jgi:chemotaxis protein CheD